MPRLIRKIIGWRTIYSLWAMLAVISLSGCGFKINSVEQPVPVEFERSQVYQVSYDKAWVRAVDWFAEHNVILDKIEKESGLLTAKYKIALNDYNYLECEKINVSGVMGEPRILRGGSLNMTLRKVDAGTKVTINFFGEYEWSARDAWDGRDVRHRGNCISTGRLERKIFEFLAR